MATKWNVAYNNNFTETIDAEEYSHTLDQLIREREVMYPFLGDSKDYYVLEQAADAIKNVPGLICEIGLRRGGGTKIILNDVIRSDVERTVIAIDPYGSIPFEGMEGEVATDTEYSNAMEKDTLEKMYRFVAAYPKINFIFFPLEDTEFFKRYAGGVPVYVNNKKTIMKKYALVHFDGPHTLDITMNETKFFLNKTVPGSHFVYDDVKHFYDHNVIKDFLEDNGWGQTIETKVKASYIRLK